jgi:hypothetical protein
LNRLVELTLAGEASTLVVQRRRMVRVEPEDPREGLEGLDRSSIL